VPAIKIDGLKKEHKREKSGAMSPAVSVKFLADENPKKDKRETMSSKIKIIETFSASRISRNSKFVTSFDINKEPASASSLPRNTSVQHFLSPNRSNDDLRRQQSDQDLAPIRRQSHQQNVANKLATSNAPTSVNAGVLETDRQTWSQKRKSSASGS